MDRQLRNHETIVSKIGNILRNDSATASHLAKCIYLVGMGSNDYVNNYYIPKFYTTSLQYTPEQYAIVLIQQFSQQLRVLTLSFLSVDRSLVLLMLILPCFICFWVHFLM